MTLAAVVERGRGLPGDDRRALSAVSSSLGRTMALHLHRAARTDALAAALGDLLAEAPADPFVRDLVLVPAKGTERWLSQRLSHRLGSGPGSATGDGVCAAVDFRSPRSLVAELTDTVDDPWSPGVLAWPLLEVLDASLEEPWARPLAVHLGRDLDGEEAELRRSRRYAVARRLAGLLASYAAQRPDLLAAWSRGEDVDGVPHDGGAERALPQDLAWQPPLWRALAARVDAPTPAERHAATSARLRSGPADHLPPRVSLFGHTRMPRTELELLVALADHHALHLFWPHPSADLWRRLDHRLGAAHAPRGPVPRREDPAHNDAEHPLLATLGRDVRELQRSLRSCAPTDLHEHVHEVDGGPAEDTLLARLQSDLRANEVRPAGRRHEPADRSVQVHACHGPARQVDVLREVLLGLLADDPTLEPRDILVMCPDIETYAPLVTAAFGLGVDTDQAPPEPAVEAAGGPGRHPGHRLRVRLADRALTRTNPLLGVAASLLDLAGGRVTASLVLDLLQQPPVRRRFSLDDDDLDAVTGWVRESGVRWGLDQQQRAPYGLAGFVQNTWRFGLDRVLAGVALSDDSRAWVGTTLPLDDVGSNRIDLAGRLAEFVDRLTVALAELTGPQPLSVWLDSLGRAVATLARPEHDEAWQAVQVHRELATVLADAGERSEVELRLRDVRALLEDHLAGRPTRANFRTGSLTVATMVPMRSVPHRVVCVVGLDDGVFPRQGAVDGDDVLARTPMTGERDARSEDRQLLLDAIGAATGTLVVTCTGADEHTGRRRPPAVPLGELLDALDRTTGSPVREHVLVEHPLQPFDPRAAADGRLGTPGPFTFDPAVLAAARVMSRPRPEPPPFLDGPLAVPAGSGGAGGPHEVDDVPLAGLVAFLRDPVRGFFRALDVSLPWEADGVSDAMPVEIDGLETWGVGNRMLEDMLRGTPPTAALAAEWRRGQLPPGRLGWRKAKDAAAQAEVIARAVHLHRRGEARAHDVDVTLRSGRRLTGTVAPVHEGRLVARTYSTLSGKHLVEAWVRMLALASHDPDRHWTSVVVGRAGGRGTGVREVLLGPPDDEPQAVLEDLVRLYDAGRREPLPLPVKTSYAWANARHNQDDPAHAAGREWTSGRYPAEDAAPAHVRVWGPRAPLAVLMDEPRADEQVEGESTRLGALATRLWLPLLRAEVRW